MTASCKRHRGCLARRLLLLSYHRIFWQLVVGLQRQLQMQLDIFEQEEGRVCK
jgi:hypothetical protein